jgi:hypothetical protein
MLAAVHRGCNPRADELSTNLRSNGLAHMSKQASVGTPFGQRSHGRLAGPWRRQELLRHYENLHCPRAESEASRDANTGPLMPAVATLVIYLSAAEAANPASTVLLHSAQEILGDQARVSLQTRDPQVSDDALANAGIGSDAVAQVVWLDSEHHRAAVHCYVEKTHRLVQREITFDEAANDDDRERMLGFVVASMLPPGAEFDAERPASSESTASSSTATVSSVQSHYVGMAEVVGLGASGIGGTASGLGAEVGGRWLFAQPLALRVAVGVRRGDIPEASATSEVELLSVGLTFESAVSAGSRFAFGGRAGALVLRHEVDHLSSDDRTPDRKSRVLPGADAIFEAAWHFSASAGIVAGVGAELAFGHTDIFVKGSEITEIPPLRAVAELGIQAKF